MFLGEHPRKQLKIILMTIKQWLKQWLLNGVLIKISLYLPNPCLILFCHELKTLFCFVFVTQFCLVIKNIKYGSRSARVKLLLWLILSEHCYVNSSILLLLAASWWNDTGRLHQHFLVYQTFIHYKKVDSSGTKTLLSWWLIFAA